MIIKDFYTRFGLEITLEKERERFKTRVATTILDKYHHEYQFWKPNFLNWLTNTLGEDWNQYLYTGTNGYTKYIKDKVNLKIIVGAQFERYLLVLELIYEYMELIYDKKETEMHRSYLDEMICSFLKQSAIDLGIFWKDGKFYQAGSKKLDQKLIVDVLDWLNGFPDEKKDFENALKAHMGKRDNDAIGDCYNCVEGIARKILKNDKILDNNKEELIAKLGFSQEWKSLIVNFMKYANEYKRHASDTRHKANAAEVEAFIYLTGLITRICIKK